MTIVWDTTNPQEAALFDRLYTFLTHQPETKCLSSSWSGNVERCAITTKEPKGNV